MVKDQWGRNLFIFLAGLITAYVVAVAGGYLYLKFGDPPVAAADASFPLEAQIVHVPLHARIERELQSSPIPGSEATFTVGAKIYATQCASCHGVPGHDVPYAQWMYPRAPQLWKKHKNGVVGVSDDEPGETFWKVKNGIRLTGMPAYQHVLSETEMWQVSLLLKNADQPQSPAIEELLKFPAPAVEAPVQ